MVQVDCEFIAGGANTTASSVVWLPATSACPGEAVAYSVHNVVAVVDMATARVVHTLRGHTGRINCLVSAGSHVVSCGDDATVRVWRRCQPLWALHQALTGATTHAFVALSALDTAHGLIVAASDAVGATFVWLDARPSTSTSSSSSSSSSSSGGGGGGDGAPSFVLLDTFTLPPAQTPHALHLAEVPRVHGGSGASPAPHVLLFVGSVDTRVHLRLALSDDIADRARADARKGTVFAPIGALYGHQDWVTTLAAAEVDSRTLMVASGSQDAKIRLWRVELSAPAASAASASSAVKDLQAGAGMGALDEAEDEEEEEDTVLDAPEYAVELAPDEALGEARIVFEISAGSTGNSNSSGGSRAVCSVFLEALLLGHEDWVTSVRWMPHAPSTSTSPTPPPLAPSANTPFGGVKYRLFSTSMDRNMIIWDPDPSTGVWGPTVRVGDVGGQLGGSVGGNLLGFVGGCVSPDGASLLGVGYGGSFHLWTAAAPPAAPTVPVGEHWAPEPFLTGHFGAVNDLAWAPTATHLYSASADQTCRLFAPLRGPLRPPRGANPGEGSDSRYHTWRELSRPQIHGYDLHAVAVSPALSGPRRHVLYSAGDEKVLRVYDAPALVLDGLARLCRVDRGPDDPPSPLSPPHHHPGVPTGDSGADSRVHRAYIPELGLSNRAAESMTKEEEADHAARNVQGLTWAAPPLEGQIADYTVWPEVHKLYGHVNGLVCVVVSRGGRWLASASKARDAATAAIALWDAHALTPAGTLAGHESTVACLAFAPGDGYLASAGKDRTLCIHAATGDDTQPYLLAAAVPAAHKRIVWACSWTPDGRCLATGSRDGACKLWAVTAAVPAAGDGGSVGGVQVRCLHAFAPFGAVAVTALDFGPYLPPPQHEGAQSSDMQVVALTVGSESGDVAHWAVSVALGPSPHTHAEPAPASASAALLGVTEDAYAHGAAVKRVAWAPDGRRVASCGEDHCLRVYRVVF